MLMLDVSDKLLDRIEGSRLRSQPPAGKFFPTTHGLGSIAMRL